MALGRDRTVWEPMANLMALISNSFRRKGERALRPSEFVPAELGGRAPESLAEYVARKRTALPKDLGPAGRKAAIEEHRRRLGLME